MCERFPTTKSKKCLNRSGFRMTDTADAMETHVKIVAILMIIWGALAALSTLVVLGVTGVGAQAQMPGFMQGMMGVFALLLATLAVLAITGGYGLINRKDWARTLTFIVAILSLFSFPVGTAFGIYTLWVMTRTGTKRLLTPHPPPGA